jgi:hypothetical protein
MNFRERVNAALQHKEPDRTPLFEYVLLPPLADRLLGRPSAAHPQDWDGIVRARGWAGAVRQSADDQLDLALLLGHDMMYVVPNPSPPAPPRKAASAPPVAGDDPVERVRIRNDQAAAAAPPSDDQLLVYVCLKDEMRKREVDLPILAPAYAHGVWTDVELMETMVLAPEVAHRHFSLATAGALARIDKYVALGMDQIGVGGDFSGTRPMISPEAYREFIVPEVRQLSRRIHAANRYAVNASDGNLWPVLEDFLFGCEVDGYLEIDLHAGMDMRRLKRVCANRITLYGNLDCGNILTFGTPAEVRAHAVGCLEAGMGNGGHILCASNAITASVPFENYMAVVQAYRDVFSLPKLDLTKVPDRARGAGGG